MANEDRRLAAARALPMREVLDRLGIHGLRGHREVAGPCPRCGGQDRFGVDLRDGVWLCRVCNVGGDAIALVRHVRDCGFREALDFLCGPALEVSPEKAARARAEAEARAAAHRRQAERFRTRAIASARRLWAQSRPAEGTEVAAYLELRGVRPRRIPPCLRFHPAAPWFLESAEGPPRELHRGPAMVAAIQAPDGEVAAVHRTWIDLSQRNGKARIVHPDTGEPQAPKKTLGSVKGGAIRLTGGLRAPVLAMGEGIETTLAVALSGAHRGAAFWAGVSLGNMGGRRLGGAGRRFAGLPDLEDREAFLPPDWVRRLVFLGDGDSDPRHTRAVLESGLRRAAALRPGLETGIAWAPEGRDFNDVLLEAGGG